MLGKYLAAPLGVQRQPLIRSPAVAAAANVVSEVDGAKTTVVLFKLDEVGMFWMVTVITPAAEVAIDETYFVAPLVDSQPQEFAAGRVAVDWKASVTVVRQAEAAKITSDTFARTV